MAMQRPCTRIISSNLENHVSTCRKDVNISPLGIVRVNNLAIPSTWSRSQDKHVMAVQMNGMRDGWSIVVDDDSERGVATHIVNVPFWVSGERSATCLS